ncbi:MAG: HAD family phosphatase [Planctomycetes bacterium]|nr:HAD family phosphatase [Planctomycetota bacterium]
MIRALLFDCDGTLADNEPMHFRALNEALLGGGTSTSAITIEEYRSLIGLPDPAAIRAALGLRGLAADDARLAGLVAAKRAAYLRSLASGAVPVPGVADFLRAASRTYLLAVASGAWREEVDAILAGLGAAGLFRVIVTAEDCPVGKPDPAPFLKALSLLNASSPAPDPPLQPGECIVFEDSVHGVAAARAARMRSVALTTTQPGDALRDADFVAANYRALDLRRMTAFFDRRAR